MMPQNFYEPIRKHFRMLESQYGFRETASQYDPEGFGCGVLRLESPRYFLEFNIGGMGPEVKILAGRLAQPGADLAWVFAFLTQSFSPTPSGASAWLYYFPHFSMGIWGEASIAWQMARLADVLQPMWPAVFIFLDMDGPRNADYIHYQERAKRALEERSADGYRASAPAANERSRLEFAPQAQRSFNFLNAYGFKVCEAGALLVRYETTPAGAQGAGPGQRSVYVNVFHRPLTFQVGAQTGLAQNDPSFELNFDLEELAAWNNSPYHAIAAMRADELHSALNQAARQFRRWAAPMLAGDMRLFDGLLARRVDAARRASRAWAERQRDG